MKIGNLVKYKEGLNLRKAGLGLVIGTHPSSANGSIEDTYVYWQQDDRCVWVHAEWLKVLR